MSKKLLIFISLIFIILIQQLNVEAQDTNRIVYMYKTKHQEIDSKIQDLEDKGILVDKINVDQLDYMRYYYIYQEAYQFPDDMQFPIVLSGNDYYIDDEIIPHLETIENNASVPLKSIDHIDIKMVIYFHSEFCGTCHQLKPIIEDIEDDVIVVKIDVDKGNNLQLLFSYAYNYEYYEDVSTPMLFSGDKVYHGYDIEGKVEEIIQNASSKSLEDVNLDDADFTKYKGFLGFLLILFGGLVDGVNPCAMAMLLLFIGLLLGTQASRSTLISVSIAYILGLFTAYFALGAFLMHVLDSIKPYVDNLSLYISIFAIAFSIFFFLFNFYDFIVSRKNEYGKIKNQLPKGIQKFNKKIIKLFTSQIENKSVFKVYMICFVLGVTISLTEFLCTGQVYLPILLAIKQTSGFSGLWLIKLFLYNVMFVLPLIILSIMAIKARSAMETSNVVREKMHWIKLATSILFLFIAIFFTLDLLGVI